jgi:hypothetical protein
MCRVRAQELWTIQQEVPQTRCAECRKNFVRADGTCPSCTDREKLDWAYALRVGHDKAEVRDEVNQWHGGGLDLVVDPLRYDIDSTLGDRPANPALKVLGEGVPRGASRDAFIRKWWAENGHLVEGA